MKMEYHESNSTIGTRESKTKKADIEKSVLKKVGKE